MKCICPKYIKDPDKHCERNDGTCAAQEYWQEQGDDKSMEVKIGLSWGREEKLPSNSFL